MKKINLSIKKDNQNITVNDVYVAETFFDRLKGLMFVKKEKSFNLLLKNCNSVHTCFMKFNLDIYCLDNNYNTVRIYKNVKPFRFIPPTKTCKHILEMKSTF